MNARFAIVISSLSILLGSARPSPAELTEPQLAPTSGADAEQQPAQSVAAKPRLGVVSYWEFWLSPRVKTMEGVAASGLVIVNPESGALGEDSVKKGSPRPSTALEDRMKVVVWNSSRQARVLAYIPTGHLCNPNATFSDCGASESGRPSRSQKWAAVEQQIAAYLKAEQGCPKDCRKIDGFFFDEVQRAGGDLPAEFARLRQLAAKAGRQLLLAYNVGTPDQGIAKAAQAGEIVVTLERAVSNVTEADWKAVTQVNQSLAEKMAESWVLLHSVPIAQKDAAWKRVVDSRAALGYTTDGVPPNPWEKPSPFHFGAASP